jgi:hypothetical protein
VIDANYANLILGILDRVDQAVRTTTGGPEPHELPLQWVTDTTRRLGERAEHELDNRSCNGLRQSG